MPLLDGAAENVPKSSFAGWEGACVGAEGAELKLEKPDG